MSASLLPVSSSDAPHNDVGRDAGQGLFERMNVLGQKTQRQAWWLSCLVALILHASGATSSALGFHDLERFSELVQSRTADRLAASIDIDVTEPEPEPEPEEPEPEPEPEPVAPAPVVAELSKAAIDPAVEEAPPPAAAEAAAVLTAEPEPNAPLDLTAEGFISGTGTRFAGGITSGFGTATTAVRNRGATGAGVVGGTGKTPGAAPSAPRAEDKSRPAGLPLFNALSKCPFPAEADAEQVNEAVVQIVVAVDPKGRPTSVSVLEDPGHGFGAAIRKCVLRNLFQAGLDREGRPIASATKPVRIRFTR